MSRLMHGSLSRRDFLALSAMTTGGVFLTACGLGSNNVASNSPAAIGPIESELSIYNWDQYVNPDDMKAFQAKYPGLKIDNATYASNEDMLAKLIAGAKGYDIVVPTGYMVQIMIQKNLLAELDFRQLPNFSQVDSEFRNPGYDAGSKHSVPKDWGTTGFGYRTDKVPAMSSWKEFFDNAAQYKGKVSVLDGATEVVGMALKANGHSYNSDKDSELSAARDTLLKFKPYVGQITSSNYKQDLPNGNLWIAMGWNGDFEAIKGSNAKLPLSYVVPSDGAELWVDCWAVLASAPHPVAAHTFINYMLDPKVQANEIQFTYYAQPSSAAQQYTPDAIKADPIIYPTADALKPLETRKATPAGQKARDQIFAEFKAA